MASTESSPPCPRRLIPKRGRVLKSILKLMVGSCFSCLCTNKSAPSSSLSAVSPYGSTMD